MLHLAARTDGTGGAYCGADSDEMTAFPALVECEECWTLYEDAVSVEMPTLDEIRRDLEMRTGF